MILIELATAIGAAVFLLCAVVPLLILFITGTGGFDLHEGPAVALSNILLARYGLIGKNSEALSSLQVLLMPGHSKQGLIL